MPEPRVVRSIYAIVVAVAIGAVSGLASCGNGHPGLGGGEIPGGGGPGFGGPAEGSACATEGETVDCGTVLRKSDDYVTCSEGVRTCTNGKWGACIGDSVATTRTIKPLSSTPPASVEQLGSSTTCADNPCDPYCNNFVDDPSGLDGGPPFVVNDAGLTLTAVFAGDGGVPCTGLTVTPTPQTITVTSITPLVTSPASLTYVPSFTPTSCDPTAPTASWTIDQPGDATIDATGHLNVVAPIATTINVKAYVAAYSASAVANVIVNVLDTSAAPAGSVAQFAGSAAGTDPMTILYPYANTVFPTKLRAPVIQWDNGGSPASAVKVSLRYPATGATTFQWAAIIPESNPPRATIPQAVWSAFEQTAIGHDASYVVQRVVDGVLRPEVVRPIHFAPVQLPGKIYYTEYSRTASNPAPTPAIGGACNKSSDQATIRQLDPGSLASPNAPFAAYANGQCPVCHSVSANGRVFLSSSEFTSGTKTGISLLNNDGTVTPLADSPNYPGVGGYDDYHRGMAWGAITPDGKYALQSYYYWGNVDQFGNAISSSVRNYVVWQLPAATTDTPTVVGPSSSNWGLGSATMLLPTFSPDGKKLVFVDADNSGGAAWRKGISTFDFDEAGHLFSNRKLAYSSVGSGDYILKWPFFEPDSHSVIFVRNPSSDSCVPGVCANSTSGDGYGNVAPTNYFTSSGDLFSIDTTASTPAPVALAASNNGERTADQHTSFQPTVLPTAAGGYRWAVYTSTRPYGNTLNFPGSSTSCLSSQLWVTALDDTASAGSDRSHPAFWLPNQNYGTPTTEDYINERAYWVLDACAANLPTTLPTTTPPTFAMVDIGSPSPAGTASVSGTTYTLHAGGGQIANNSDQFSNYEASVTGDPATLVARVVSLSNTNSLARAGVMIRASDDPAAANALMTITPTSGAIFQYRPSTGATTTKVTLFGAAPPYWVKLVKSGSTFTGYASPDGTTWTTVGSATVTVPATYTIGLADSSHVNGTAATAVFDNFTYTITPPDPTAASACDTDQDCCGALTTPKTASCTIDLPLTTPITRHCRALTTTNCVADGAACLSDTDCCGFPQSHCASGVCAPPPPVLTFATSTFTRDYEASCPANYRVVWRFFDWETITPLDSKIVFAVQSAPTATGLSSATSVPLATVSGAPITTWTGSDVGAALRGASIYDGYPNLRVSMTFAPSTNGLAAPTLTNWRQQYDCVASE